MALRNERELRKRIAGLTADSSFDQVADLVDDMFDRFVRYVVAATGSSFGEFCSMVEDGCYDNEEDGEQMREAMETAKRHGGQLRQRLLDIGDPHPPLRERLCCEFDLDLVTE